MGTQQILMIVLSVIIVGIAVAVGIQMFQSQRNSQAIQMIASDLQGFGAQLIAFENTPKSMGGAQGNTSATAAAAGIWLGWGGTTYTNTNATYTIAGTADEYTITVSASKSGAGNGSTCVVGDGDTEPAITIANN